MNKISNNEVEKILEDDYKYLQTLFPQDQIFGIFTYGDFNYGFAETIKDLKVKMYYLPTLEEMCTNLTLKDENSKINCVIFKNNYDESLELEDGMKILATGYISVYERDGSYQLYIDSVELDGLGNLYIQYNKLKEKLSKEGLFDYKYKKSIPYMPKSIGVVTAETGAVIRDIINIIKMK